MTPQQIRKIRNSRHWRDRIRPDQLRRVPYCEVCGGDDWEENPLVPAVQVDHIVPLHLGGDPYAKENLQSLCFRCHVIKTARENRKEKA